MLPAVALACIVSGRGAGAATVSVAPADTTLPCGSFAVRAVVDAVADLKGFELIFSFDASKLRLLGVDPGTVLTRSGSPFSAFLVPDVPPADTIRYDAAMLVGSSSGPGVLAFFRFQAVAEGVSPVGCVLVDFRDSNNVQTLPDCVGGSVSITGPTPARPQTWGRVKTLYR